jgi:hypothetical protein
MQETQGHSWFPPGVVQVHDLAPFTSFHAGPALLILGVMRTDSSDNTKA